MRPFSTRSPSHDSVAGSTVSEPATAIATTRIVPMPIDVQIARAAEEHPGQRGDDRQAGDEHRPARGRRGRLERRLRALPAARSSRSRLR